MKAIYEEIIDEIGTQTLAKFGLNIFDPTSYAQSVEATRMRVDVNEVLESDRVKNKNSENDTTSHGFLFESLDAGMRNIKNAKAGVDERYVRHDEIAKANDPLVDVSVIRKDDVVKALAGEEVEILGELQYKCYESKESQEQRNTKNVVSKTNRLKGKGGAYLKDDNLKIVVNSDRYNEDMVHIDKSMKRIEKRIDDKMKELDAIDFESSNSIDELQKNDDLYYELAQDISKDAKELEEAQKLKNRLVKGEVSHEDSQKENANKFAIKTEFKYVMKNASGVVLSGATAMALQTLASGVVYEIKDYYTKKSNVDLQTRIIRLFEKTLQSLKKGFTDNAGFASLDILVNLISSFFRAMHTRIMYLWNNIRTAAKSVYNCIVSYLKGETKSFSELIVNVSKALFSVLMVLMATSIDTAITQHLSAFMPIDIASLLAGIFTIVISAVAVVLGTKAIENSLRSMFLVYADLEKSRAKRVEISELVDGVLPELIKDNEKISQMIEKKFKVMKFQANTSFEQLKIAIKSDNHISFVDALVRINSIYDKKLKYADFNEFSKQMISDEPFKF